MVKIYYHKINEIWEEANFNHYLRLLPLDLKNRIEKYTSKLDKQAKIIGKILLEKSLKEFEKSSSLADLVLKENSKPSLISDINFSISHSNKIVVVAVTKKSSLGIDTEYLKPINFSEMESFFSKKEWQLLQNKNENNLLFYEFWTKKEAILKASGFGIFGNFKEIEVIEDEVNFNNKSFFLKTINIDSLYKTCLASNTKIDEIEIKEITAIDC